MLKKLCVLLGVLIWLLLSWFCNPVDTKQAQQATASVTSPFLNMHDSVKMVGKQQCRGCHQPIYDSFIQTGMGRSFGPATRTQSKADFDRHALVYDEKSDFYYHPYFKDSVFYILEFRLQDGDTTHKRIEKVSYIVGSGHHTNSHMIDRNGYVYQAPITFYTQEKRWDLAPGFEDFNQRFDRLIATECLTCHNHYPQHVKGSANKFLSMPHGIECERCHGAGQLHVEARLTGEVVDTSKQPDYTIVNPRRLNIEQQMDLCQRCHLQGVAVLNEGKTFFDFKPGMRLEEVMQVFLPRFTNSHERFIMASQADRLRLSKCFETGELSCISCHNPHHDVKSTTHNTYNLSCQKCHQTEKNLNPNLNVPCSAPQALRDAEQNNCVHCHMPPSGSIDIPHVHITDHFISKDNIRGKTISTEEKEEIAAFLGLENLTKKAPQPLDMARGYLALYDKFMASPAILDSAYLYLSAAAPELDLVRRTWVHYHFTRKAYASITPFATQLPAAQLQDAWTAYRMGEAFYHTQQLSQAFTYFNRATDLHPYNLDFQEKLGLTQAQLKQTKSAAETFTFVLQEDPKRKLALTNYGLLLALQGRYAEAHKLYDRALALDPDYLPALTNKAGLLAQQGQIAPSQKLLEHALQKQPDHARAQQMLNQIKSLTQ